MKRSAPLERRTPLARSSFAMKPTPGTAKPRRQRPRKCEVKACKASFIPSSGFQTWCSPECGTVVALARIERAKAKQKREAARAALQERRQDRQKRAEQKRLSVLANEAQDEVNRYVRYRDAEFGCISCDKPANWDGQWHASHFRSVGAASAVRFNLWNIHKACWICNKLYSGRIDAYTPVITAKIGADRVAWLKAQNQVVKYSREYLERLKRVFAKKARRAKARAQAKGLIP